MLKFVLGPIGSGKTNTIDNMILDALQGGKKVTLLVPEQEAIEAENRIYDKAKQPCLERLSVLSFRRLANYTFRKYGGIQYNNLGDSGRLILLYRIIRQNADSLKIYNNASDRSLIELLLSVCAELKRYSVTPEQISAAAITAKEKNLGAHLESKLSDIAKIYSEYCAQISEKYPDSSDDITKLAEKYDKFGVPTDEVFFIDSFNGFTEPELNVLERLIKGCQVTIALTVPSKGGEIGFFTLEKTKKQLEQLARKAKITISEPICLLEADSSKENDFHLIKYHLFDNTNIFDEKRASDKIQLARCTDAFTQAEYIAQKICEHVRNGARYKDIAVITRGAERYEGVLDLVFERYGIPLFLSKRNKLTDTAVYKTIILALRILSERYNTEDVMSYAKSGLCKLTDEDIALLESYVCLWKIDKHRWLQEDNWAMNPKGFTSIVDENAADILLRINDLRHRIIDPIQKLGNQINNASVSDACSAIYEFMTSVGIIDYYTESTDASDATAYNTFITLLETLVKTAADLQTDSKNLASLLYLMAKNTDYGAIPATFDRVTAGDASLLRVSEIKHVFLTDCENGVFPSGVTDDSFFSDTEKEKLASKDIFGENKITLSPNITEKNDLECFYFLRAACGARETLCATYCIGNSVAHPSFAFTRLSELFDGNKIKEISYSANPAYKLQTLESFKNSYQTYRKTDYFDIVKELAKKLKIADNIPDITPLVAPQEKLSTDITDMLYHTDDINMSYSRFQKYLSCPFAYFCEYEIKMQEQKHGFFHSNDMGSYVHSILEKTIASLFAEKIAHQITEADIDRHLGVAFNEVLNAAIGKNIDAEGERFKALISRMLHTIKFVSTNIVEEFKNSEFVPKFFELPIKKGKNAITPLTLPIDENKKMFLNGFVDRVDIYEADGKLYVKVLDYKSNTDSYSVKNIEHGFDTQMILYLYAILESGKADFLKLLDKPQDTEVLPAGILYQGTSLKVNERKEPFNDDAALKQANGNIKRIGCVLNTPQILNALEKNSEGKFTYIKVPAKNAENLTQEDVFIAKEDFQKLYSTTKNILSEKGKKMLSGEASATPTELKGKEPCKYCKFKPICRSAKGGKKKW